MLETTKSALPFQARPLGWLTPVTYVASSAPEGASLATALPLYCEMYRFPASSKVMPRGALRPEATTVAADAAVGQTDDEPAEGLTDFDGNVDGDRDAEAVADGVRVGVAEADLETLPQRLPLGVREGVALALMMTALDDEGLCEGDGEAIFDGVADEVAEGV